MLLLGDNLLGWSTPLYMEISGTTFITSGMVGMVFITMLFSSIGLVQSWPVYLNGALQIVLRSWNLDKNSKMNISLVLISSSSFYCVLTQLEVSVTIVFFAEQEYFFRYLCILLVITDLVIQLGNRPRDAYNFLKFYLQKVVYKLTVLIRFGRCMICASSKKEYSIFARQDFFDLLRRTNSYFQLAYTHNYRWFAILPTERRLSVREGRKCYRKFVLPRMKFSVRVRGL